MHRSTQLALLAVAGMLAGTVTPSHAAASPGNPVVIATGLNNPRQLALLGRGLLVAEAGRGGDDCTGAIGCLGTTGSVTLVRDVTAAEPAQLRVLTGLLSAAEPDGSFATGPAGVDARSLTMLYVAMAYAPGSALPVGTAAPVRQLGKLLSGFRGRVRVAADVTAVELAGDPDTTGVDSDPSAVLALPDRQLVADAGGNDIIEVRGRRTRVFAVLPAHDGHPAMPAALARGPGATILAGEFGTAGTARVWILTPAGTVAGWIGGFTTVTGVGVGPDGSLYVSELIGGYTGIGEPPGQVTRLEPGGLRTSWPVPYPGGLAVDRSGHVFVAAWSISDEDGSGCVGVDVCALPVSAPPGQVWMLSP